MSDAKLVSSIGRVFSFVKFVYATAVTHLGGRGERCGGQMWISEFEMTAVKVVQGRVDW